MKITIFGLAGTGTSTSGKLLAKELGYEFKSTGNMMREVAAEHGMTMEQFDDKITSSDTYEFDIELDNKVSEFGNNNDNFVFESRLAWNFISGSIKIKFVCKEEVAYERIAEREQISLDEAREMTKKRAEDIRERYSKVYPDLTYPPSDEVFDLVVDTDELSPDEIVKTIVNFLESRN